jgi:ketosteroid isomerase-like protein
MSEIDIATLAKRLDQLEAEKAIIETMYAYGRGLDYGERDTFLNCFTSDAHYLVDMRLGGPAVLEYRGHDELAGYYEWHTHAPDAWHKHVATNPAVTIEGDRATAVSYFLRIDAETDDSKPATVSSSGRYLDQFAREQDGAWRIRSRHCEVENH